MTTPEVTPLAPQASPEGDLFRALLPPQWLNDLAPGSPQIVPIPWVVIWLLVFQRLNGNATLTDAVSELILRLPPGALPDNEVAGRHTLSTDSEAYSLARTDPVAGLMYWVAESLYGSLVTIYPPSWGDRRVYLFESTTVQLPSTRQLRAAYPPAGKEGGSSNPPILHLLVGHELRSGLALLPEYGPAARSELALASGLLARLPAGSIVLGARSLGMFTLAWAAVEAKHDATLLLTQSRFDSLRKKATPAGEGKWAVTWEPSAADRKSHPELPQDAGVKGWLHEVQGAETLTVCLFTTLDATGPELAELYHKREDLEADLSALKETLELSGEKAKSVPMVGMALVAAVQAYNLTNQVRRVAAKRLKVGPRRLSFAGVRSLVRAFAPALVAGQTGAKAEAMFDQLLQAAGQLKLPQRSGRRKK